MNKTVYEQGVDKGPVPGQRALVRDQPQDRFGPLPPSVIDRLTNLPAKRVNEVWRALLRATSLKEFGLTDE